jgi:galactose mutarotase-like enzyme
MEIYTIESEYLLAKFRNLGGELIELYDKITQTHRLKRGDNYWSWYAPTLFPIVGRAFNDTIWFHNQPYKMEKHGFLRKSIMEAILHNSHTKIEFRLFSNDLTKIIFPFDFEFQIHYSLENNRLKIVYVVIKKQKENFPFQVGAHPAFNLKAFQEMNIHDHFLEFNQEEKNIRHYINSDGYFTSEIENLPIEQKKLFLKESFFEKDAIILKNIQSNEIHLKNIKNSLGISLSFDKKFKHFGIWKPLGADFVCLEPWCGCADVIGFDDNFAEKETFYLTEEEITTFSYEIKVY